MIEGKRLPSGWMSQKGVLHKTKQNYNLIKLIINVREQFKSSLRCVRSDRDIHEAEDSSHVAILTFAELGEDFCIVAPFAY